MDDTIRILYDLTIEDRATEIILKPLLTLPASADQPGSERERLIVIYSDSGRATETPTYIILNDSSGVLRLKGEVVVSTEPFWLLTACSVEAEGNYYDCPWSMEKRVQFDEGLILSASLLPPFGVAYFRSTEPNGAIKNGFAGGIGFNAALDLHRFQFRSSYDATLGADFEIERVDPIGVTFHFGDKNRFSPSVFIAPRYSTLRAFQNTRNTEEGDWGLNAGLVLEGPFERLSYSYCTGFGGYHEVSLYLAVFTEGPLKWGTQYEYYHYDQTDMFRVICVLEGVSLGRAFGLTHSATNLQWPSDRPAWHTIPASVGLIPFGILAAGFSLMVIH